MTFPERGRIGVAVQLEYRGDRGDRNYDQIIVSTLIATNGTLISTGDVAFSNAATKAVAEQYRQEIDADHQALLNRRKAS
jgi:hypothetical protein